MFGELEAVIFHKLEICSYSRIVELYEKNALIWISLCPWYPKMCLSVLNELFVVLVYLKTLFLYINNVHKEANFQSLVCLFSIHKVVNSSHLFTI